MATSLLDTRWVAGDKALADELSERAGEQWCRRGGRWLARLAAAVEERHQKAGEVAFLLEPDLKEGRGGLRDVHAIHWAEATGQLILPIDEDHLPPAYEFLLAVRVELHHHTGKSSDRLNLQDQDAVATALGLTDADDLMLGSRPRPGRSRGPATRRGGGSARRWPDRRVASPTATGPSARDWCCGTASSSSATTPTWPAIRP